MHIYARGWLVGVICFCVVLALLKSASAGSMQTESMQWQDGATFDEPVMSPLRRLSPDAIGKYMMLIKKLDQQNQPGLALHIARDGVARAPDAVALRLVLAYLYIKARPRQCEHALPQLHHAEKMIDSHSKNPEDIRGWIMIVRMRELCEWPAENMAFLSMSGERSPSLLGSPGPDVIPIDKGSLIDRYCVALGSLCQHQGMIDLKNGDRGGTTVWFHVGTFAPIRTKGDWMPAIRTNVFRKLNSKPDFGLHGAKIQLEMKRYLGETRRLDASIAAQSAIAHQGPKKAKLAYDSVRVDMRLWHQISKQTLTSIRISETRILQNRRHSKRIESSFDVTQRINDKVKVGTGLAWATTLRKGGGLPSSERALKFGISVKLSSRVFASLQLRHLKTVYTRPLAYLHTPHKISRREQDAHIGVYLSEARSSLLDFHFVRTSSVSHFTPDNFTSQAMIISFTRRF